MQSLQLDVTLRDNSGKGAARKLRAAGLVPAVVYGSDMQPLQLQIERRALERVMHSGVNALIDLRGPDAVSGKRVLVKEIQRHPVKRVPVHCDLYAVDLKKKVHVQVPVHYAGRPRGVELQGGVMEPLLREIEVACLPLAIPDSFEVDVSALEIGDTLHVSNLSVPEGVEILDDLELGLVQVAAPRVEEAPAEGEEAEIAEGAAPAAEEAATSSEGGGDGD